MITENKRKMLMEDKNIEGKEGTMKKLICVLLAVAMLMALAACGTGGTNETEPVEKTEAIDTAEAADAVEEAAPAGERTLTVAHASKVADGFDPPVSGNEIGLNLVYDTLFIRNPDNNNEIEGLLAADWEYTDDCTLNITLADATFSNGASVTAEDVLYSLQRIMDTQSQYMDYYTAIDFEKTQAVDDKTLTIVTVAPTPMLLAYLALPYASVLCKDYVESSADEMFWDQPVGSGPYTVVENVSGSHTTYAAREDYWGMAPEYDTIVVNNYTDQTAMYVDFETGLLDVAFDFSESDAKRLQNGEVGGATMFVAPSYNAIALALPEYTEVFSDIRVRQAICEAIDIDAVTQVTFGILATPATSVIADGIDYHKDVAANRYDPEHARQLLEEAGYADGLDLRMVICAVDFQEKSAEAMQAMLADVGINLIIESYDIPTAVGMFMSGDTDIVINANSAAAMDPAQVLMTSKSSSTNLTTAMTDVEYNGYLEAGETTLDSAERQTAYEAAQQWMADNFWQIPLADRGIAYAYADTVESFNVVVPSEPNLRFVHPAA